MAPSRMTESRIGSAAGVVDGTVVALNDVVAKPVGAKPALLELRPDMVDADGRLVDGFHRGILYAAENITKYGRIHTARMLIVSEGVMGDDPSDDIAYLLNVSEGGWKRLSPDALPVSGLDPK